MPIQTEVIEAEEDQPEELMLSPSTYAWRFDEHSLSSQKIKIDNFLTQDEENDEFSAKDLPLDGTRPILGAKFPMFSSYLPSGMTLDDVCLQYYFFAIFILFS